MSRFRTRCLSALEKVFPDTPQIPAAVTSGTCLRGAVYSFQVAYQATELLRDLVVVACADGPLQAHARAVGLVPCELVGHHDADDYVLRSTAGLYPDPLMPIADGRIHALPGQWRALWVTIAVDPGCEPGDYAITVRFTRGTAVVGCETFGLRVCRAVLPALRLLHTEWFYADCLAAEYRVAMYSPAHWELIESYLQSYIEYGMNVVLTPLFTPPLELRPGTSRPRGSLVGVSQAPGGSYAFDFALLGRWLDLCRAAKVSFIECSHLFTQWGARHAPEIVTSDGELLFGWHTDAGGAQYGQFLAEFLPALLGFADRMGWADRLLFHVSDEPGIADLDSYRAASDLVRARVGDRPVIDALSDVDFFDRGVARRPVISTEHIESFAGRELGQLWVYYCSCEYKSGLSNRFIAMPSQRNRILGTQLFAYNAAGFLHWGYNFWFSQKSEKRINPFACTDADHGFPAGDAFLVYPGEDGPIASLRLEVLRAAMADLRALQLLEEQQGPAEAAAFLTGTWPGPITFQEYPRDPAWTLMMRDQLNELVSAGMPQ